MASSTKVSSPRSRRKQRSGTASRPYSLDRMQLASGQGAEDRAEELSDWLEQFDNGTYRDDIEPLSIREKF